MAGAVVNCWPGYPKGYLDGIFPLFCPADDRRRICRGAQGQRLPCRRDKDRRRDGPMPRCQLDGGLEGKRCRPQSHTRKGHPRTRGRNRAAGLKQLTDAWIPLACKYCGEALRPPTGHIEPGRPDVMLFCSVHGPMGQLEDFAKAAASEAALKPVLAERVLLEGGTKASGDEHRSPSTNVPTEASGWRSMVRRSMARLVAQPGQNTSSQGVLASSAALIVGDHSMSRPVDRSIVE
jgi:hypothetical protein